MISARVGISSVVLFVPTSWDRAGEARGDSAATTAAKGLLDDNLDLAGASTAAVTGGKEAVI